MDSGIYQIVVDAHAPRSRFEQDPVAQSVGARQQRPALPVGSGEGLLTPCRRPRLQVVIQKASPGEIAPEMLHRLCSHEPRQIAAEKLCELFLPFFCKFAKILRCHCLECKRKVLLLCQPERVSVCYGTSPRRGAQSLPCRHLYAPCENKSLTLPFSYT